MTLPIVLRRKAGHDLASAYNWYEEQRRNLGEQWLSAITASFQTIAQFPEMFPPCTPRNPARDPKLWPR